MHAAFTLRRRNSYPWLFAIAVAGAACVYLAIPEKWQTHEVVLGSIGGLAAFFHFLYSQHNHNTERFIGLFKEFNERYDRLNGPLNEIARASAPVVATDQLQVLYDYFNLCAEEYLYFQAGYIDAQVWQSWCRGMSYFASMPEVRRIWETELQQRSYYGFSLGLLPAAA